MLRHSLFFESKEQAEKAEKHINEDPDIPVVDSFLSNDGESQLIECRFFTEEKLPERELTYLIRCLKPAAYSCNCFDG